MVKETESLGQAGAGTQLASLSLAQSALVALYVCMGLWYLTWRPTSFNPDAMLFSSLIYGAEVFGFACALLFLFMCWSLKLRSSPPVPADTTADVFVPTINESVDMVRRTVMSAMRMRHVGQVWLLDDGNRPEMQDLAHQLGCRYLTRTENSHAKAGNLNNALRHCNADYVAIFDADHAPAPTFLEETLGFFADPKVAFVQTPQDFYNLDSFQHRVDRRGSLVWSEQMLFFRVIQPGKDRLNSAFFCGSCAIIRRAALDDIGGFATGTVTEDIHTSLLLHKRGWKSVYHGRSLAFGLAPATAIPFLKQRLRWGQGAMQMWRREGVLATPGLTLAQRLSYLGTLMAYFEGWQRGILFLGPVIVLGTGVMPIHAIDREFMIRFIPYMVLNYWVFEEVARGYGRSLLTEQYTMIRFAVFISATFGFFLRKLRFVVTPKEMGDADATRRTLWPQYVVLALNAAAIPVGILFHWRNGSLETGALVANVLWASLTLGVAALAISYALRLSGFRRREYRFPLPVPFKAHLQPRGVMVRASDISPLGCRLSGDVAARASVGDIIRGDLLLPTGVVPVNAIVRSRSAAESAGGSVQASIGCEFDWATVDDRLQLETFLFGSDLQLRLNGWEERVHTPLERLSNLLSGSRRGPRMPAGQGWSPLVYRRPDSQHAIGVGFISMTGPDDGPRTVVMLDRMPTGAQVSAHEVTEAGPRHVNGRLAGSELIETHAEPLYLYRLTA
jgi:cellulose synthase (UDP-forming)